MPGVRAYQVLASVAEHGTIVRSEPAETAVDTFTGATIEVWVSTVVEPEALAAAAKSVPDIAAAAASVEGQPAVPVAEATSAAPTIVAESGAATGSRKQSGSTVRVDSERLDALMHLMGELVVHRTRAESLAVHAGVPELAQAMSDLTRTSQALQAMVMQVRMIPVEAVFLRFPRLVRDLSTKLGKQVELVLAGQDTELDRSVVESLGDPIVHLVRNSLDHGLESAEERLAAGKPATGTLEISAEHLGGNVVISVRDDGRGVNPAHVAKKAAERGLIPAELVSTIDMRGAIELLFSAGFSTAEQTSDISGRGVGMDAVRTQVRELGGEVLMTSEPGVGTVAQIRLPLTLAIMAALLVGTKEMPFALPLDRVERTLDLDAQPVRSVAGSKMLVLRDGVLPLVDLSAALGYGPSVVANRAVIVRSGDRRIALAVERLIGQRELVTRPLPPEVGDRAALSGGAVLSDGEIALIVDCDALGRDAAGALPIAA
jgi:two-component system chemotaxis sensor kinase CheA